MNYELWTMKYELRSMKYAPLSHVLRRHLLFLPSHCFHKVKQKTSDRSFLNDYDYDYDYAESTHSIDPAIATVLGNLPGLGERTVYFLRCVSIAVLQRKAEQEIINID